MEGCATHSQVGIVCKFIHEELKMVGSKGNVGIEITNDIEVKVLNPVITGIESINLSREVPLRTLRHP